MSCTHSLADFEDRFPNEQACRDHLQTLRWGEDQYQCRRCGETEHWGYITTVDRFECYECGLQTSVTADTLFQDTKLDLKTWFRAAYLILTSKKGTSGPRLADRLGVTEKTAHRLRMKLTKALQTRLDRDLRGLLEVDESYVGGIDHGEDGRGTDKAVVQGWAENRLDHAGRLRLFHRSDASKESLTGDAHDVVDRDSAMVHSDGWAGYRFEALPHHKEIVGDDRAAHEVFPHVHIAFSNLSRLVEGVHTHVSEAKLQGYLDLFSYRFNHRERLWEGFLKALRGLAYGEPWAWGEIAGARLGPAA